MEQKRLVLVDTDILIKSYRGNEGKRKHLEELKGRIAISSITVLELMQGAKTEKKLIELNKQLKAYHIIHVNERISERSVSLSRKYVTKHHLLPPDNLIAATALEFSLQIYTDNINDYNFIQGMKFYNP